MTEWTARKSWIGVIQPVTRVTGETSVFILGTKPLGGHAYGLTPQKAREVAAVLVAAADEIENAPAQGELFLAGGDAT